MKKVDLGYSKGSSYQKLVEEDLCFNLRKLSRKVTNFYDKHLSMADIKVSQLNILLALLDGFDTQTAASVKLGMDRTTYVRNLSRLCKAGLISLKVTEHKRKGEYALTDKGLNLIKITAPLLESARDKLKAVLGKEKYDKVFLAIRDAMG